jgi:uncharacterized protein (TIGR01244 family)
MAAGRFARIDGDVYVAPQLRPEDFAAARDAGVRTVVNNRPDGEAADQIPSAEAERLAREAGLGYLHIPVASGGGLTREAVDAFAEALGERPGPLLAYCRSGTRSTHLWALAAASRGADPAGVVEAAARAGYDVAGLWPVLARLAAEAQPAAGSSDQR